jgi:hypothetical protein
MHKHAETQIHKPLLQIEERPSATRSYAMHVVLFRCSAVITGQHCSRRRLGSEPKKLSSRRHLRSRPFAFTNQIVITSSISNPCPFRRSQNRVSFLQAREMDVRREFDRELWILSKKLTGIYFQTEDFALFCCAL